MLWLSDQIKVKRSIIRSRGGVNSPVLWEKKLDAKVDATPVSAKAYIPDSAQATTELGRTHIFVEKVDTAG